MKICKNFMTCIHHETCKYAKPNEYTNLAKNSLCYNLVEEKHYNQYLRFKKIEKINGNNKTIK